jgi:CDP-diacylglycerol--serine O-phosphatidyltransferase
MKDSKRLAYFLPNIFTALNMACGFGSIILSNRDEYYQAALILVLGGIFDLVDGRIARLLGTQSSFGEQFDSLSDIVTFGVAPALLVYNAFFVDFGRLGQVISFLFCLCAALRLARFNANIDKVSSNYFQGLPSPAGAMALAGLVLFSLLIIEVRDYPYLIMTYVVFYAFLMISNIPFYSFKNSEWVKQNKRLMLFVIFVIIALLVIHEQIMILAIIQIYVISCLIYFLTHRSEFKNFFNLESDNEVDHENK